MEGGIGDLAILGSRLRTQGLAERRFDEPAETKVERYASFLGLAIGSRTCPAS